VLIVRNYRDVFAQCARMEELEPPPIVADPLRHVAPAERAKYVAENSIIIGLGTTVKQLTTYRDHIVIATSFNVLLLDGRKIPDIPPSNEATAADDAHDNAGKDAEKDVEVGGKVAELVAEADDAEEDDAEDSGDSGDSGEKRAGKKRKVARRTPPLYTGISTWGEDTPLLADTDAAEANDADQAETVANEKDDTVTPTLRAHVLLGNHQQSMKLSSCLQADARSIYLTYWAAGAFGDLTTGPTASTPAARDGLGLCVKVWTFGE
jgi:hypothetical protein